MEKIEDYVPVDEALSKSLLVTQHSILDLFRNESNLLLSEKNFCSLKEHVRSLPMLAEFTSSEFYKDEVYTEGLRIMTSTPDRQKLVAFKDLHVEGTRTDRKGKKFHPGEAFKVIELILSLKCLGKPKCSIRLTFSRTKQLKFKQNAYFLTSTYQKHHLN